MNPIYFNFNLNFKYISDLSIAHNFTFPLHALSFNVAQCPNWTEKEMKIINQFYKSK